MYRFVFVLGCSAVFLVCGCAEKKAAIGGRVSLDNEPVEIGVITFEPVDGTKSPSSGAQITKGEYQIPQDQGPFPGTFRVEIRVSRKTGKRIPAGSPAPAGTMVDEVVEAAPEKYNKESTLRFEVKPGTNAANFDLSTK